MSSRRTGGPALAGLGGLVLAAGGSAGWVERVVVRAIAGVPLPEAQSVAGTEFAPWALPLGLVTLLLSAAALFSRGRGARVLAASVAAAGAFATAAAPFALVAADRAPGTLSPAAWLTAAGAVAVLGGGVRGLRPAAGAPLLDDRYTVEGSAEDREWELASDEGADPAS